MEMFRVLSRCETRWDGCLIGRVRDQTPTGSLPPRGVVAGTASAEHGPIISPPN
ncbi:hypothetical protein [Nonomuraea dietziae]|uniref:hypothetical protein n=1 Tax=Nonomuraea dietziae TaxID=65515 RepID=UPI0031CE2E48